MVCRVGVGAIGHVRESHRTKSRFVRDFCWDGWVYFFCITRSVVEFLCKEFGSLRVLWRIMQICMSRAHGDFVYGSRDWQVANGANGDVLTPEVFAVCHVGCSEKGFLMRYACDVGVLRMLQGVEIGLGWAVAKDM